MSVLSSPEMFINMKSIPDEKSSEYDSFFENEAKKIEYGVRINGVYIHGWLYWHLNHWKIYVDEEDPLNKRTKRIFTHPYLRDNEWIVQEGLIKAENEKRGLMVFGSRRIAKSEISASMIGRNATIFEGTENAITGGNWPDINLITDKLDKGLSALHSYFRHGRLTNDFRKEINLGFKDKPGNRYLWSKIMIRNFENGQNPEAAAGITAFSFLMDEIGKFPFLESFEASKPCFASPYGWRCVPFLTGTSGLIEPDSDAQKVFENPDAHNFVSYELKEEGGKKVSLFIPGTRRMETKVKSKFGDFIKNRSGILIPDNSELNQIEFWDSDLQKGLELCQQEQDVAKKSKDPTSLLKAKMYYPTNTSDLFITISDNRFPVDAAKEQLAYLESQEDNICQYIRPYRDADGKARFKFVDKDYIQSFPTDDSENKDACMVMYEPPMENPPYGLYIAGGDPYNTNDSVQSPSLGTIYIYKRFYDPINGTFQKTMVLSYAARPKTLNDWYKNVELILEVYNATLMIENADRGFIQYMDQKNKGHILADGMNLLKEITPNTKITGRDKGLPPTIGVINYSMGLFYDYCNDEEIIGYNDITQEEIKQLGVRRIKDKMLLKEMIGYRKGINVDRIVAFRHVLAYEKYLDKIMPNVEIREKSDNQQDRRKKQTIRSPFMKTNTNPFSFKSPFR